MQFSFVKECSVSFIYRAGGGGGAGGAAEALLGRAGGGGLLALEVEEGLGAVQSS